MRVATLLQAEARRKGLLRLTVEDVAAEALVRMRGTPDRPGRAGRAREIQSELAEVIAEAEVAAKDEISPKKSPAVS